MRQVLLVEEGATFDRRPNGAGFSLIAELFVEVVHYTRHLAAGLEVKFPASPQQAGSDE